MRIGVVGAGVVGNAMARCFMEHAEVRVYDIVKEKATHSLVETLKSDLVFLCLPTPQKEGHCGACDTSYLDSFFEAHKGYEINFVLKSTVPIGYTRSAREKWGLPNLVHSPEFLTARCATVDAMTPSRNIVGCPRIHDEMVCRACHALRYLYVRRFPGVPLFCMSSDESEAVKLFLNSFFAVKVAYFNEVRELADKLGLNWDTVMEGILSDGRIAHAHTQVPGPDGHYGYSGTCLPKDIASLISCIYDASLYPAVTSAAYERNIGDRKRG